MKNTRALFFIILLISSIIILNKFPTKLGLDLQGGINMILRAVPNNNQVLTNDTILGTIEVIRNRIDALGVAEPVIRAKGKDQISVELPGINNPEEAKELIGRTAKLEFIKAEWLPSGVHKLSDEKKKILIGDEGKVSAIVEKNENGEIILERPILLLETSLTGADLSSASAGADQFNNPIVNIEFTKEGASKFFKTTSEHQGKPLAIKLDDVLISAPNINEAIAGGRAQISGSFTPAEVKTLVIQLQAGALPVPVEIISERVIGPTLGEDSIIKSQNAFIIGVILILIYMILTYRFAGLLSSLALLSYILFAFSLFKLFSITLTLPGIAGFILTIGMAVDANIIIFERIKEESLKASSRIKAIESGFDKAYTTILDANITTLIAAIVLFWLGTGSIKGFAIALSIGIFVSMFTAISATKMLLLFFSNKRLFSQKEGN